MSTDLDRLLEGFLAELGEPDPGVGERALARTVSALRPAAPSRRRVRAAVLAFAAAAILLLAAAGSLAAAGALHVSIGKSPKPHPAATQLSLPKGANAIAVVVDGRLSVVTKSGFRLQGLPVTSAALSPHALYVAAGVGDSLVAMRPDGGRAWSHPVGGTVVSISWAPDGLRIAYVVGTSHGDVLHVIWGNGRNDTVIDSSVRAVRPSWRADSLAFAYVGAGGGAVVYDLRHASRRLVVRPAAVGGVTQLVFGPTGSALVVGGRSGMVYVTRHPHRYRFGPVEAAVWLTRSLVIVSHGSFAPGFEPSVVSGLSGPIVALAASGDHFVAAVGTEGRVRLVAGRRFRTIAVLPRTAVLRDLQIG